MRLRSFMAGVVLMVPAALPAAAQEPFDHGAWDRLMRRRIEQGFVDYRALVSERSELEQYLAGIADAQPDSWKSPDARLAFWINAYNAYVIRSVLDHYPLPSVKNVKGFFDKTRHRVGGLNLTLNEIEAKGRALHDARIHFALVCGAWSCPPLRAEAYQPDRLGDQLDDQGRRFLADPERGLRVDGSTLWLSKIFDWYEADFTGGKRSGFLRHITPEELLPAIQPFVEPPLVVPVQETDAVMYLPYNWVLNDQWQNTRKEP